jgi:hypothetical protein
VRYSITTGVQKQQLKIKTAIIGLIASTGLIAGVAVPAFAANDYCGSSSNGCDHAIAVGAQCGTGAGSGAFGYLGKGNNPGDPSWDGGNGTDPGTSGHLTGLNNSALCGNRQGNL